MMKSAPIIVTDSTCDLPPDLFARYGIRALPLRIQFGQETYQSGVDMNLEQFAQRLQVGDVHPSSSQPTVADFKQIYEAVADRPILSIHISEGLSGTINAARQAAQQLPDQMITIWDSQTISGGLGLQVLAAARAADAGHSVEEIMPMLERARTASHLLFTLDDLSFLLKGGRIGQVQYHVAQVLKVKPIVTVSKAGDTLGTYITAGRVRSLVKAVDGFADLVSKNVPAGSKLRAMAFYGLGDTPNLVARLMDKLKERFDCVFLESAYSTPVLGVHVGPLAFALGYAAGDWDV
ncbi:MAG TPA: DegV family protein [Aggregatilineaceae bacterium]|nr:DegV family protein [Aggregatilineaceae bacterium]